MTESMMPPSFHGPSGEGHSAVSIAADLRTRIINGQFTPGQRLLVRKEFEAAYGVSSMTMLRAFQQLMDDGFVITRRRGGTFVALNPPNLSRYGLVLCGRSMDPHFQRYFKFTSFLYEHAMQLHKSGARQIQAYMGIDGHRDDGDFVKLEEDVKRRRLAGLIFTATTYVDTPVIQRLLDTADFPSVIFSNATGLHRSLKGVDLELRNVVDRSLEWLAEHKRKNVAVFLTTDDDAHTEYLDHALASAAALGINIPNAWVVPIHAALARFARNHVQLMMTAKPRPDAILVLDDVLVEHVTGALADLRIKCPRDIQVVAHANFPFATPSYCPALRIGFDVPTAFNAALQLIDKTRSGDACPNVVLIEPRFEETARSLAPVLK